MSNVTTTAPAPTAGGTTTSGMSDEDKLRVRQQERTVDNLNRLFAMLFSIVFSVAAASSLQRLSAYLKPPFKAADWEIVAFNAAALVILGTTAAIFFHQASRGLDLQYGASPDIKPHRGAFIFDYLVIVLTMVPFALMGKALDVDITEKSGFFWFFISHELLILFGLSLLIVKQFRLAVFGSGNINPQFAAVGLGVERYWFIMNSVYLFFTALSFCLASGSYTQTQVCPLFPHRSGALFFMFVFFTLAMLRNSFDYFWMWNVFFPVKPAGPSGQQVYLQPLQMLIVYEPSRIVGVPVNFPMIFGYLFLIAAVVTMLSITRIYDLSLWIKVCS